MADNVTLPAQGTGSTTPVVATEDIAGAQHQLVKLVDGTATSTTRVAAGGGAEAGALRVTVANDSTGVLSVDDNAASLTVDAPVGTPVFVKLSDGAAALEAAALDLDTGAGDVTRLAVGIAAAASGGPVAVPGDVTNGLDVDVTRVQGTVTVDGSAVTQPVSAASLPLPTGAATSANQLPDGHNVTIDNAAGAAAVNIQDGGNIITVDGTITANAGTGDFLSVAAHTMNEALKEATAIGGQFDDTTTTAATEDNVAPVRITAQRGLHANLRTASGTEAGTAGSPLRVDPTGSTTQPVSGTVTANAGTGTMAISAASLPLPSGAATETTLGTRLAETTFTTRIPVQGQATMAASVPVAIASNQSAVPVSGTVTANLAAGTNTNEVVGDVAHDVAAAGNPVLNAGISQDSDDTAPPNRVNAEGDATRLATDRDGALFVRNGGPQNWSYHFNGSTAQTDTVVHATPGAGLSLYVGTIVFSSNAATAINLFFEEGASTVIGPFYLEAVAGRGMAVTFNPPRKITANTALTFTTSAAIAHSVDVTGFTAQG